MLLVVLVLLGLSVSHSVWPGSPWRSARSVSRGCSQDSHEACINILLMRGGAVGTESVSEAAPSSAPINIIVKNFVGGETGAYAFLDKKIRITATSNCTVQEIKEKISEKFPGYPPSCIQRLFFTNRLLRDEDVLGNITTMPSLVLTLDIISGTTVYQKTVSVSQALEAYVSTLVHQAYIGSLLSNDDDSGNSSTTYNFVKYRKMFDQINATIYEKYADDIAYALEKEKNPETITADTVAWRGKGKNISPLKAALAKEFDMNGKGLVNMIRFSITMAIFAFYGTSGYSTSKPLLMLIPFMWVTKLRQARLLSKILLNALLPIAAKLDFVMPLLPAPYQVLAKERLKLAMEGDVELAPKKSRKDSIKAAAESVDETDTDSVSDDQDEEEDYEEDEEEEVAYDDDNESEEDASDED